MAAHRRGARPCASTLRRAAGTTPAIPGIARLSGGEKGGCLAHPHPRPPHPHGGHGGARTLPVHGEGRGGGVFQLAPKLKYTPVPSPTGQCGAR